MTFVTPGNEKDGGAEAGGTRYSIRAVDRALDILDLLKDAAAGLTLIEISKEIGLPRSSAFRYLITLEARGHVSRDGEMFRAGSGFTCLALRDVGLLVAAARPRMGELHRRFEETVNLGALDESKVAYLEILEGPKAMRFAPRPGSCDYMHSSALGKSMAARMTEEQVLRILAREGMPSLTPQTITEPAAFLRELETVRAAGYAVDNLENEPGVRCVAVALPGTVAAAISVSAPALRFTADEVEAAATALKRAGAEIADEIARGRS